MKLSQIQNPIIQESIFPNEFKIIGYAETYDWVKTLELDISELKTKKKEGELQIERKTHSTKINVKK